MTRFRFVVDRLCKLNIKRNHKYFIGFSCITFLPNQKLFCQYESFLKWRKYLRESYLSVRIVVYLAKLYQMPEQHKGTLQCNIGCFQTLLLCEL